MNVLIHWKNKESIPIYLFLIYYSLVVGTYMTQENTVVLPVVVMGFCALWLLLSFLAMLQLNRVRLSFQKHRVWLNGLSLFLAPMTSFLIVELMVSNFNAEMFEKYSLYNLIWYYVIALFIYAVVRDCRQAVLINNFIVYLVAVVNYLVFLFRGNPIIPSDLLAWQTGMSVASGYSISISVGFLLSTLIMFAVYVLGSKLEKKQERVSLLNRLAGLSGYFLFAFLIYIAFFQTDLIKSQIKVIDFFAPKYTYCTYGTIFGFVANVEAMETQAPEGYSVEQVKEALQKADKAAAPGENNSQTNEQEKPNIIVIMSEAYSDLNMVGNFPTNLDYHPYTRTLTENTTQGAMYVSVFGGGTSDTEYEFLTGNSMAVMPKNCVPYQQFVTDSTDSLAATLKEQGYYNIAIHPYKPSGYKRDLVYPLLGFDEFISEKDFVNPHYMRSFISDKDSFQKIIEEYEAKKDQGPLFLFNVTMQNHGGYSDSQIFDDANTVRLTEETGYPQAEQYLSLLRQSDLAFQTLVDYFSQVDEHTIILIFGDHQPVAFSGIHDQLAQNIDPSITYQEQNKYKVPFLLWANYDIQEDNVDEISANYLSSYLLQTAGLKGTAYNNYLLQLRQEIPVISALFYIDKEGVCHQYSEDNSYSKLLQEYKMVGYNDALDRKEKLKELFSKLSP